jgi:hypothetical protein
MLSLLLLLLATIPGCQSQPLSAQLCATVQELRKTNEHVSDALQTLTFAARTRCTDGGVLPILDAIQAIVGPPSELEIAYAREMSQDDVLKMCNNTKLLLKQSEMLKNKLKILNNELSDMESHALAMKKLIKLSYLLAFLLLIIIIVKKIF